MAIFLDFSEIELEGLFWQGSQDLECYSLAFATCPLHGHEAEQQIHHDKFDAVLKRARATESVQHDRAKQLVFAFQDLARFTGAPQAFSMRTNVRCKVSFKQVFALFATRIVIGGIGGGVKALMMGS